MWKKATLNHEMLHDPVIKRKWFKKEPPTLPWKIIEKTLKTDVENLHDDHVFWVTFHLTIM